MKRLFFAVMLALAFATANAQTPTYTVPQSVTLSSTQLNMNGVTSAVISPCLSNVGQTVHSVFYAAGGAVAAPTGVQLRLEASFNSDSATCTTGTWFPISDDGADPGQNGTGEVLGLGTFPFLRLNLVNCTGCSANSTISASYTGTSSIPGNPFGLYGAGQQIRKYLFVSQTQTGSPRSSFITTPYGSTAGFISLHATAFFTGPATLKVFCGDVGTSPALLQFSVPTAQSDLTIPVAPSACSVLQVQVQSAVGVGNFSAFYFFYPPGAASPATAQPANTKNSEVTAVNATASVSLAPSAFQRAHVFAISARCSAGTAQLLVVDTSTSTNLWTSAATEVGTTTFAPPHWNPGLPGASGDTIQVQLTTCGAANTGTLDVQGSIF